MRALGPGSVSSVLKVILDVVYHALWVLIAVLIVGVVIGFIAVMAPATLQSLVHNSRGQLALDSAPTALFEIASTALYTLGIAIIIGRLRQLFAALTAGDPFHPDNVRRLQVIALVLGALEAGRIVAGIIAGLVHLRSQSMGGLNLTAWFAVLVVFVLAEVFREGARLRREAELTI